MQLSRHLLGTAALTLLLPQGALSLGEPCPLIGAYYPAPSLLGTSEHVRNAVKGAEAQLKEALKNGTLDGNTTSLSIDVYSLHDESPLYTFHYTPELLISQRTVGVEKIDSNTVYRIGSVSKLWTAYLYLITAGDRSWNYPITDFIPELAALAKERKASDNAIDNVAWEDITVGSLASHMAGLSREPAWNGGLAATLKAMGLPDQGGNSHSTCGDAERAFLPCNRTAFFQDYAKRHPSTTPFLTPAYSNGAYQIFSYALENITGRALSDDFQTRLVEPLGLNATYYFEPNTTDTSFIPINATVSWWNGNLQEEIPAGGYYSTINDMTRVGKAMLNFTLLSPAQTRRWIKPQAFTSSPNYAVGAPWEIIRAPGSPNSWIYTKTGDLGAYSGVTALMPDLNIGMSILAAGSRSGGQVRMATDILAENFVPAFWAQAKDETSAVYAGTYTDKKTNSTITVAAADDAPGLIVNKFILGGQDVLQTLSALLKSKFNLRLYHMGLSAKGANGTTTDSWRAIFETPASVSISPSTSCISWMSLNQYVYGGVGLDEFLFTIDPTGKNALALESRIAGVGIAKNGTAASGARKLARTTRLNSKLSI
ncbi:uncharacterized protein JN550_010575 [Neoarthrinium moseri]|uniref:uncharacterized protein n=1 Tax=Neoarthrinium moseri TaxID=1658444 RepID=UPI001FDD49BE|nr:uncharacterized protein JN550_010575 [Neoarthrinium moseri]KAI1861944.1 hypothetical protein JN550_010575 [Neoarthrinium moseri]